MTRRLFRMFAWNSVLLLLSGLLSTSIVSPQKAHAQQEMVIVSFGHLDLVTLNPYKLRLWFPNGSGPNCRTVSNGFRAMNVHFGKICSELLSNS